MEYMQVNVQFHGIVEVKYLLINIAIQSKIDKHESIFYAILSKHLGQSVINNSSGDRGMHKYRVQCPIIAANA